jgi:nitrous oxide reductase accessory protein NosL
MRSSLISGFLFLHFFCACSDNNDKTGVIPASENDVDAARNFINAVLQSDFTKAGTFIINDSLNKEWLYATERSFKEQLTPDERKGYTEASINIHSVQQESDSVSIINYSNSFKKKPEKLKVVKTGGQWLVDLKYTFSSAAKDSIP